MLFQRIESPGVAHFSYLVGDGGEAFVIDPRRDIDVYLNEATRSGYRVTCILETHRNEDFVVGSVELAEATGARIWHADAELPYEYGEAARDGQTWHAGRLAVRAISTPGHTPGSMSYLLDDPGGAPWIIFTGDTLFAGDVGRVDLPGRERIAEMASLLYDSLFQKILPLGDEIIVCPSHGAGSVCGTAIAERPWTTIGLERRLNPKLASSDKRRFMHEVTRELERPPYFLRMEVLNLKGAPVLKSLPVPPPLEANEFAGKMAEGIVIDTRMETSFGAAHVPGAFSLWLQGLPAFAGWYLPYDTPLYLVNDSNDPLPAVRALARLGYDSIAGYLAGGMTSWHAAGRESRAVRMVPVHALCRALDGEEEVALLDVRSDEERTRHGRLAVALEIHLTQLPEHLEDVPRDRPVYIFCGTGLRSMTAASVLARAGLDKLVVVLGGGDWLEFNLLPDHLSMFRITVGDSS